jgi:hypothetical protein
MAHSFTIIPNIIGFIIGILVSGLVFYFIFSHKSRHSDSSCHKQLKKCRQQLEAVENEKNKLNDELLAERQQWQEERSDLLLQHSQIDSNPFLDQTLSSPSSSDTDHQADQAIYWNQERQNWLLQKEKLEQELDQLQQEKAGLEVSLKQVVERRKQEREQLQQNLQGWQQEIAHLHRQKELLSSRLTAAQSDDFSDSNDQDTHSDGETGDYNAQEKRHDLWRRERRILHVQITKIQADKKTLEAKLVEQRVQAEKEKQALEEEIEQLMDRMLKLQMGSDN